MERRSFGSIDFTLFISTPTANNQSIVGLRETRSRAARCKVRPPCAMISPRPLVTSLRPHNYAEIELVPHLPILSTSSMLQVARYSAVAPPARNECSENAVGNSHCSETAILNSDATLSGLIAFPARQVENTRSVFLWNFDGLSPQSFAKLRTGHKCAFPTPSGIRLCDLAMRWPTQSVFGPVIYGDSIDIFCPLYPLPVL